ncbi:DNA cytosine methyltransferase [Xanthomonas translucens]|uniref:DNA cytosine methyltransferase n=1 Tax=Xanthomonas campestris pv. translucens TaxID=343 RepID=UPI000A650EEF|nr:DNA cytosine methyltransferase [Xanthomonas translucens]WLA02787.1 DNA cytosine methyltransferase [Xanthomonas translucens]
MRGDSAPRREAGQSVAGTIAGGARQGGGYSADDTALVPAIAGTIGCHSCSGRSFGSSPIPDNLVPVMAFAQNQRDEVRTMDVAGALAAEPGMKQQTYIAFGCKDSDPARSVSDDVAPTLRAMGHTGSHANAGGQVAVAFQSSQSGVRIDDVHATLDANNGPRRHNGAIVGMQVRRLTPRECERLQGAPDDWTLVPLPGRHEARKVTKDRPAARWRQEEDGTWSLLMADGPRYKMLGNSFAAPVIRWIGERIERAQTWTQASEAAA